jgi:hypothetical protein
LEGAVAADQARHRARSARRRGRATGGYRPTPGSRRAIRRPSPVLMACSQGVLPSRADVSQVRPHQLRVLLAHPLTPEEVQGWRAIAGVDIEHGASRTPGSP